jgi:hypothetical protein
MKDRYGHMGDVFDDIKEIYSSLPVKAKQRIQLLEVAEKLADMSGEFSNLQASFGDFYEEKERALGVQRV